MNKFVEVARQLILISVATLGIAADPPESKQRTREEIDRRIEQLSSSNFKERMAAAKALEGMGEPAIHPLRRTAVKSEDAEVRRQAEALVTVLSSKCEVRRTQGPKVGGERMALSPDTRRVLYGSIPKQDGKILLWDMQSGKELRYLKGHSERVGKLVFSPAGRRALSTGFGLNDTTIRLWDLDTGQELRCFEGHRHVVYCVAFSPDGRYALSGGAGNCILRLWDLSAGTELRRLKGHTSNVADVGFSPDGRRALSASLDGTMRLWDVETGKELNSFVHGDMVYAVAFSPRGRQGLSVSGSSRIIGNALVRKSVLELWDLDNGTRVRSFDSQGVFLSRAVFSPDGSRILAGSSDATLHLWDVKTGEQLRRFRAAGPVVAVAFSADGRQAISGTTENVVQFWALPHPDGSGKRAPPADGAIAVTEPPLDPAPKPASEREDPEIRRQRQAILERLSRKKRISFDEIFERISKAAAGNDWQKRGWRDLELECLLEHLIEQVNRVSANESLKLPVRFDQVQFEEDGPLEDVLKVVKGGSYSSAKNSVLLIDGCAHISFADDSVIIATGAVSISHSHRNVVLAGQYINVGHDGSRGRRDSKLAAGSLLVSGGGLHVSHAHGSICAARDLLDISHATKAVFVNSKNVRVGGRRDYVELQAPALAWQAPSTNPLADKVSIAQILRSSDRDASVVLLKCKGSLAEFTARSGTEITDDAGKPVRHLAGWKLCFVAEGFALFSDGKRYASFFAPR